MNLMCSSSALVSVFLLSLHCVSDNILIIFKKPIKKPEKEAHYFFFLTNDSCIFRIREIKPSFVCRCRLLMCNTRIGLIQQMNIWRNGKLISIGQKQIIML